MVGHAKSELLTRANFVGKGWERHLLVPEAPISPLSSSDNLLFTILILYLIHIQASGVISLTRLNQPSFLILLVLSVLRHHCWLNCLMRSICKLFKPFYSAWHLMFPTTELHVVIVDLCSPSQHMIIITIRSEKSKLRISVPAARMMLAFVTKIFQKQNT